MFLVKQNFTLNLYDGFVAVTHYILRFSTDGLYWKELSSSTVGLSAPGLDGLTLSLLKISFRKMGGKKT